jgi:hypothetical protein
VHGGVRGGVQKRDRSCSLGSGHACDSKRCASTAVHLLLLLVLVLVQVFVAGAWCLVLVSGAGGHLCVATLGSCGCGAWGWFLVPGARCLVFVLHCLC